MDKVDRIVPRVQDPSLHHCLGPHTLEDDSVVNHGIYGVFRLSSCRPLKLIRRLARIQTI